MWKSSIRRMKHIFIFLIILVFTNKISAQNINVAHHTYNDLSSNIVSVNSKNYYLEQITYGCCATYANLVGTDETGQILFQTLFAFNDDNWPIKLIKTNDHCLALLGKSINCDVGTNPAYLNFLIKLDTTGAIQFQTYIQNF